MDRSRIPAGLISMEPKARVSSRPPSLVFPLSDKGGEPLQAESDSESRTCLRSSKPASKSDRKAKPFLPIQAGEAAYFLGQRALHPPNSFHFSQGLRLDLRGRSPWDPSF
ncbi:orf43 [Forsythia ovata]|uniref:Uncharacterized protein n=2 Tax=Oleaceae TaxID=4144 RepID=A0AAD1ZYT5_9LAMI|nr:unnamed protein product [Fraxinus pennsylvanica]